MRQSARPGPRPPILVGEAHTFGVGLWAPGRRGRGTLTLSEDGLRFEPAGGGRSLRIPMADVTEVGVTSRMPRSRVLVVTYRGNLVIGLTLEDPYTWANAVQTLTGLRQQSPAAGAARLTRFEIRRFRLAVTLLLLVVAVLSTALPLFFTWMHDKVAPEHEVPRLKEAYSY